MFNIWSTHEGISSSVAVDGDTCENAIAKWIKNNLTLRTSAIMISVLEDDEYEVRYLYRRGELAMIGVHEIEDL